MKKILVTGSAGQLGQSIQALAPQWPKFEFRFATKEELNLEDEASIAGFFKNEKADYCINTAAYTNVEKAESEEEKAFKINAEGAGTLAKYCAQVGTTLLQISTDYVFNGEKAEPYNEQDTPNPLNVYGASKLRGEELITEHCEQFFILRTSWLYSLYGHNFLNTVLGKIERGENMQVTTEQIGTPTFAGDLAQAILQVISGGSTKYGLYHFSNLGEATWFSFAQSIFFNSEKRQNISIEPVCSYPTQAKRPKNSVLNTEKFSKTFNIEINHWQKSLEELLHKQKAI